MLSTGQDTWTCLGQTYIFGVISYFCLVMASDARISVKLPYLVAETNSLLDCG